MVGSQQNEHFSNHLTIWKNLDLSISPPKHNHFKIRKKCHDIPQFASINQPSKQVGVNVGHPNSHCAVMIRRLTRIPECDWPGYKWEYKQQAGGGGGGQIGLLPCGHWLWLHHHHVTSHHQQPNSAHFIKLVSEHWSNQLFLYFSVCFYYLY